MYVYLKNEKRGIKEGIILQKKGSWEKQCKEYKKSNYFFLSFYREENKKCRKKLM